MPSLYLGHDSTNVGLSKARLPGSSRSIGGLSAPQISQSISSAVGSLSAPRINPGIADTRFSPMPIPKFTEDITFKAAAGTAQTWANAAFQFKEREDTYYARKLVNDFENITRRIKHGEVKPDGSHSPGYMESEGEAATNTYGETVGYLTAERDRMLQSVDPSVRQKALLQISNSYNSTVAGMANHRARQLKVAEQRQLAERGITIQKLFEKDPFYAWSLVPEYANSFNDPIQREKVLADMMKLAVDKIESEVQTSGGSPTDAYKAQKEFFDAHREETTEATESTIDSYLRKKKEILKAEQVRLRKEAIAKYQGNIRRQGGTKVYNMIMAGEAGVPALDRYYRQVVSAYNGNIDKANDAMYRNYSEALSALTQSHGYQVAAQTWEDLKSGVRGGAALGDVITLSKVNSFVASTLPQLDDLVNTRQNNDIRESWNNVIDKATTLQELGAVRGMLNNEQYLTDANADYADKIIKAREKELKDDVDAQVKIQQNLNYLELSRQVDEMDGPDPYMKKHIDTMYAEELISWDARKQLEKDMVQPRAKTTNAKVSSQVKAIIRTGDVTYDPVQQMPVFKQLLPEREQEALEEKQVAMGKSPEAIEIITEASLNRERKLWLQQHPDKTDDDWVEAYMNQKPGVQQGIVANLVEKFGGPVSRYALRKARERGYGPTEFERQEIRYQSATLPVRAYTVPGSPRRFIISPTGAIAPTREPY